MHPEMHTQFSTISVACVGQMGKLILEDYWNIFVGHEPKHFMGFPRMNSKALDATSRTLSL